MATKKYLLILTLGQTLSQTCGKFRDDKAWFLAQVAPALVRK